MYKLIKFIFDKKTNTRIFFLLSLFMVSILLGYFFGYLIYKPIPISSVNVVEKIEINTWFLFRKLFFNNYQIAIIMVFLGYFSGGIITILLIMVNGVTFGFQLNYLSIDKIGGIDGMFNRLIFHAPFEILALCLMGSLGLHGFDLVLRFIRTKEFSFDEDLVTKKMVFQYFTGTLLLLLSALIESLVSKIL